MNKRKAGVIAIVLFTITAALHLIHEEIHPISDSVLFLTRWIFLAGLALFAGYKRSLTTWIFTAMAIGIEIGVDFPAFSQNLRFLSTIFLRLIKTIVAPLLFSTLVVGIASHSNLKQV